MELWQHHAALHLSPRMASGISLPAPGVLRLAAAGVDMSLPTSGNQVSSIWRPLAPGDIMTSGRIIPSSLGRNGMCVFGTRPPGVFTGARCFHGRQGVLRSGLRACGDQRCGRLSAQDFLACLSPIGLDFARVESSVADGSLLVEGSHTA